MTLQNPGGKPKGLEPCNSFQSLRNGFNFPPSSLGSWLHYVLAKPRIVPRSDFHQDTLTKHHSGTIVALISQLETGLQAENLLKLFLPQPGDGNQTSQQI